MRVLFVVLLVSVNLVNCQKGFEILAKGRKTGTGGKMNGFNQEKNSCGKDFSFGYSKTPQLSEFRQATIVA